MRSLNTKFLLMWQRLKICSMKRESCLFQCLPPYAASLPVICIGKLLTFHENQGRALGHFHGRQQLSHNNYFTHLQQIDGTHHVIAVVQKWLFHALPNSLDCRKMNHAVDLVL
jgi:hypothetical protein